MNRRNVISIAVLVMTVVILPVGSVQADHYFCAGTDNTWNDGSNWKSVSDCSGADAGVPTAADKVIILSGKTCNVDVAAAVADSLTVESTATLNVQANKKLSLDSSTANTTITGTVNLQGSASELAFEDNDQTIDGAGKIVGQNNLARITVVSGKILTNETTIEGALKITGSLPSTGTFLNHGTVHANTAGTLEISTAAFDDDSTALWKISTSSSAVLRIDVDDTAQAPILDGDWTIADHGTLDVDSTGFDSNGSLTWTGGTIDVADGCVAAWF